ncbi:entericidin A/B family lipoprotein [Luteolibacter algae]|uniref:Entericidin A/B family lipoprotein n=1 Tax=Luteolibacter algae TaxID=454151 RepID=A0ABW5D4J9_9BACT
MNPLFISKTVEQTSKKPPLRMVAMAAGAATILALASTSCATTRGFGQDVEKVGDEIQTHATH